MSWLAEAGARLAALWTVYELQQRRSCVSARRLVKDWHEAIFFDGLGSIQRPVALMLALMPNGSLTGIYGLVR
jgi:hypothetical protein